MALLVTFMPNLLAAGGLVSASPAFTQTLKQVQGDVH